MPLLDSCGVIPADSINHFKLGSAKKLYLQCSCGVVPMINKEGPTSLGVLAGSLPSLPLSDASIIVTCETREEALLCTRGEKTLGGHLLR